MSRSPEELQRIEAAVAERMAQLGSDSREEADPEFQHWLDAIPERRRIYAALRDARALGGRSRLAVPPLHPAASDHRRPAWHAIVAIAALLVLVGGSALLVLRHPLASTSAGTLFAAGDTLKLVTLGPDDLAVLDRGGRLLVDQSGANPAVELVAGRARIASRGLPFHAAAGVLGLTARDATFDIDVNGATVTVTILQGGLSIERHQAMQPIRLVAGQRLTVRGTEDRIMGATRDEMEWTAALLPLDGRTLGDIVAITERQGGPKLVLASPALATLPLQGQLRTTDIGALARQLAGALDLAVHPQDGNFVLALKN